MKDGRETSFKVNHSVAAEVFDLLVGYAFQRFFGLHDRDSMRKPFKIFREAALVGALMEPVRQRLWIVGWKFGIFCAIRQFDYSLWSQYAVQVFVQQDLRQSPQLFIELHWMLHLGGARLL